MSSPRSCSLRMDIKNCPIHSTFVLDNVYEIDDNKDMNTDTYRPIDAGTQRGAEFAHEHMDCTVHATAIAAQIPYFEAHQLLARFGRRPRRGVSYRDFIAWATSPTGYSITGNKVMMGPKGVIGAYRVQRVNLDKRVTLGQFLKDFPNGRFVVRKSGHVFAVIDGKQFDASPNGLRCRLTGVYHFERK